METLLAILLLGLLAWLWVDGLRAREQVLRRCTDASRRLGVQLLDQTVSLVRMGSGRDPSGRLRIRRTYQFEFSTDGQDRLQGYAVVLGDRVELMQMDLPDGSVILPEARVDGRLY
jgi:hypothetical protein